MFRRNYYIILQGSLNLDATGNCIPDCMESPNNLAEMITLLTCILRWSVKSQPRYWLFWLRFSVVSLLPQRICWYKTLNWATAASFRVLYNSLLTEHPTIQRCIMLALREMRINMHDVTSCKKVIFVIIVFTVSYLQCSIQFSRWNIQIVNVSIT
jgi:hypothetical protein